MHEVYQVLNEAFAGYLAGAVSGDALKPVAAPYGIYQQRDGRFMIRVRVNGGEIDVESLKGLAEIAGGFGGAAHVTSRQDLQLHDVPAERVAEVVAACDRLGWPFKGGGGNTYRNTVVGADSGLSPDTVFDVYPYADALNQAIQGCEKAYALPRKLKIGLFAREIDTLKAAVQDLGFVASVKEGERGFRVYAGGGLGRESSVGVCLVDFLPAERLLQAALALVALFYDHGDRANRQRARLRFVLGRLGPEAFMRLFWGYYVTTEACSAAPRERRERTPSELPARSADGVDEADFERWRRIAVLSTRFGEGVKSVRLFVPYGNLAASQLRAVAELAAEAGSPFVRLLATQDVLIPFVGTGSLRWLYQRLRDDLPEIDLTFLSYRGHIMTCVGATVCKIGMVDAPAVADRLAAALDRHLPADTPERQALQRLVADEVRISGCPNACAGHPAARFGVGCINRNADGAVVPHARVYTGAGVTDGVPRLSEAEPEGYAAIDDMVEAVTAQLAAAVRGEARA